MKFFRYMFTNLICLFGTKTPKILLEFFLIAFCYFMFNPKDGYSIFKENFITIMFLYGILSLIIRIVSTAFMNGFYSPSEIMLPIYFIIFTFALYLGIQHFNPNFTIEHPKVSQEEMAKNCPEAKWSIEIDYKYNNDILTGSKNICVQGTTAQVEEASKNIIAEFFKKHPDYTYTGHSINLYFLPKKHCTQNHYPPFWYDNSIASFEEKHPIILK